MCRWITLLSSDPVSLSDIVLTPSNSLLQLAKDASRHPEFSLEHNRRAAMNGDGFGIGWYYNKHGASSVFKESQPAWHNENLREICLATKSHCMMAHVRSASEGMEVSQANCHPFKCGRLLFCHNGRIDSYAKIKRRFIDQVSEEIYSIIHGTTDSECIFALLLTHLANDGEHQSPLTQTTPFGHVRLVSAIKKTLRQLERLLQESGIVDGYSTFNFSLTDGDTVVVTRFCDKFPDVLPPSLYFSYGTADRLYRELTNEDLLYHEHPPPDLTTSLNSLAESTITRSSCSCELEQTTTTSTITEDFVETTVDLGHHLRLPSCYAKVEPASFIVASNPLTKSTGAQTWHSMPKNSVMWCTRGFPPELRLLKGRYEG